jgi:hypothetical protein
METGGTERCSVKYIKRNQKTYKCFPLLDR